MLGGCEVPHRSGGMILGGGILEDGLTNEGSSQVGKFVALPPIAVAPKVEQLSCRIIQSRHYESCLHIHLYSILLPEKFTY